MSVCLFVCFFCPSRYVASHRKPRWWVYVLNLGGTDRTILVIVPIFVFVLVFVLVLIFVLVSVLVLVFVFVLVIVLVLVCLFVRHATTLGTESLDGAYKH